MKDDGTNDNISMKVSASLLCCLSFLVYGASAASLGAALPTLSASLNVKEDYLGIIFTARGIGYLLGTLISAAMMDNSAINLSKQTLTALSILLNGVCMAVIEQPSVGFNILLLVFGIQGLSFGGIDTFANCALPELWTTSVNPWMQTMHASFAVGALIGPALVGRFRFHIAFLTIAISSLLPFIGIVLTHWFCVYYDIDDLSFDEELERTGSLSDMPVGSATVKASIETTTEQYILVDIDEELDDGDDGEERTRRIKDDEKPIIAKKVLKISKNVPFLIKIGTFAFYFIYVGAESGFSGWISTYSQNMKITTDESLAAYLTSAFWTGLTIGRLLAILQSLYFSASAMVRFQLVLCVLSSIAFVYQPTASYLVTGSLSLAFGFALSSIFPLMMIVPTEYGFVMDPNTTTLFVVGGTIGEAALPICIGWSIATFGSQTFPSSIFICVVFLVALYLSVHGLSKYMPECAKCRYCQEIVEQVLGPLCDSISQSLARGKTLTRWNSSSKDSLASGSSHSSQSQRSVRFNPVVDVRQFFKYRHDYKDDATIVPNETDNIGGNKTSRIEMSVITAALNEEDESDSDSSIQAKKKDTCP